MADSVRAFVAVDVNEEVRAHMAGLRHELDLPIKWVDPGLAHLTLKFLGNVPQTAIVHIAAACSGAAAMCQPFDLAFEGLGAFPGVLWMGITSGLEPLRRLQRAVERELAAQGFPPEDRPFSPHLTLARLRHPQRLPIQGYTNVSFGRVRVDSLQLMRSVLGRDGPTYDVLASWRLGQPNAA